MESKYQEYEIAHYWGSHYPWAPVTGVSFAGYVYIFYAVFEIYPAGIDVPYWQIRCAKMSLNADDSLTRGDPPQISVLQDKRICGITCCVHRDKLYLFYATELGDVYLVRTSNGVNWESVGATGFKVNPDTQIAAVSTGMRLFVFGSRKEDNISGLQVAHSKDGANWSVSRYGILRNVRNVAACTLVKHGIPNIFVGWVTDNPNDQVHVARFACEEKEEFIFKVDGQDGWPKEIVELRGTVSDHIALTAGSTEGGRNGHVVQLFVNGRHGNYWSDGWQNNRKVEFTVENNTWNTPEIRNAGDTRYPSWGVISAFPCYKFLNDDQVQQEIWHVMTYSVGAQAWIKAARFKSDKLTLVTSTSPEDLDEQWVPPHFSALIGVVEGPPPYYLNGASFDKNGSTFNFGTQTTEKTTIGSTIKLSQWAKIGGTLPIQLGGTAPVKAELKIGTEQVLKYQESKEKQVMMSETFYPVKGSNHAISIYVRPRVKRRKFELRDWEGKRVDGTVTYLFEVTKINYRYTLGPSLSTFNKSPDTHNITTWLDRFIGRPSYVKPDSYYDALIEAGDGMRAEGSFQEKVTTVKSGTFTVSAEVKASTGVKDIFNIEAGSSYSYSYEISASVEIGTKVGYKVDYPQSREKHAEDIKRVDMRMLFFEPAESGLDYCYWIPKKERELGNRPWCIAWTVDKITYRPEPKPPQHLIAASEGERGIRLTWEAVDGEVTYNVKRSTVSGLEYSVIAQNISEREFADTTAVAGRTYFYKVSAANADGESLDSNEASTSFVTDALTD